MRINKSQKHKSQYDVMYDCSAPFGVTYMHCMGAVLSTFANLIGSLFRRIRTATARPKTATNPDNTVETKLRRTKCKTAMVHRKEENLIKQATYEHNDTVEKHKQVGVYGTPQAV